MNQEAIETVANLIDNGNGAGITTINRIESYAMSSGFGGIWNGDYNLAVMKNLIARYNH